MLEEKEEKHVLGDSKLFFDSCKNCRNTFCLELTIHSFQTGILGMFMIQLLFYDCGEPNLWPFELYQYPGIQISSFKSKGKFK